MQGSGRGASPGRTIARTGLLMLPLLLWPDQAHAYLDPGTGSMIVQAVLAAILGLGIVFRKLRFRIWSLLKRIAGSRGRA